MFDYLSEEFYKDRLHKSVWKKVDDLKDVKQAADKTLKLNEASKNTELGRIRELLTQIVPEYNPNSHVID